MRTADKEARTSNLTIHESHMPILETVFDNYSGVWDKCVPKLPRNSSRRLLYPKKRAY